jgi:hypothetical protein
VGGMLLSSEVSINIGTFLEAGIQQSKARVISAQLEMWHQRNESKKRKKKKKKKTLTNVFRRNFNNPFPDPVATLQKPILLPAELFAVLFASLTSLLQFSFGNFKFYAAFLESSNTMDMF